MKLPTVAELREIEVGWLVQLCDGSRRSWVRVAEVTTDARRPKPANFVMRGTYAADGDDGDDGDGSEASDGSDAVVEFRGCHVFGIQKTRPAPPK